MPTEFRNIIFSNKELRDAIILYNEACPQKLPDGEIIYCEMDQKDDVSVNVTMRLLQDGLIKDNKTEVINLTSSYIGASLINYCFSKKIPLPRNSIKSIQISGDNISLRIKVQSCDNQLFKVVEKGLEPAI